jgi:hypothetical protein
MDTQHKVKGKLQESITAEKQTKNKQAKMIRKANYEQKTFDCETRYNNNNIIIIIIMVLLLRKQ